jgi:hypothetical protein
MKYDKLNSSSIRAAYMFADRYVWTDDRYCAWMGDGDGALYGLSEDEFVLFWAFVLAAEGAL